MSAWELETGKQGIFWDFVDEEDGIVNLNLREYGIYDEGRVCGTDYSWNSTNDVGHNEAARTYNAFPRNTYSRDPNFYFITQVCSFFFSNTYNLHATILAL